ncbi:RNA polymerase II transcription factor B subunit 1 [Vermiconidia calcicola]|uniref:RNA polymerase II transcription factor B subunit 1 n=1 Tax=Vermiconidia calcicola TaxID=1690605 RepID=A0ACC3NXD2_9PEZI|nr:RNA polymerase II transcription factor B subunit 1 [Vermiconidia calcicola]
MAQSTAISAAKAILHDITLDHEIMPPTPSATVSFKKKDGSLTIASDNKYLYWTPQTPPNSSPSVTIPVANITNLQQTPESSPKVALKVFVKDDSYVFSFISKDKARKEQEAVTESLRNTIAANKQSTAQQVVSAVTASPADAAAQQDGGDTGQSAAMAIAKAVSSKAADEGWYDDNKLKSDYQLQRSLLESNKALQARFNEALKDRPESVSVSQFTTQFWSARLHLLRAHAIEKAQKQGEYNVLPEIRFTRKAAEKEGEPDIKQLHITKEQIKLIFRQYPVVKEAYDENVPPLDPGAFWQRFFSSRLLKKLKGEKIAQYDPPDSILDKYLERRDAGPASIGHVPHFIDLEGNEQNHSQRKGNRPDQDMRPSSFDKVPVLRVLNNLSEKMLSHVAPEDGEAHRPIGMDEDTFDQLRLRDLAREDSDNRVKLSIRQPGRLGRGDAEDDLSAEAKLYAQQDPQEVLTGLQSDLQPSHFGSDENGLLRLDKAIAYHTDSDYDSDSEAEDISTSKPKKRKKIPATNSHSAIAKATSSIFSSIHTRRSASSTDPGNLNGLTQQTFDQLTITHNTTTEFLHYFWSLFLSGDASHTTELSHLVSTLDRSLDRINAVAATAEQEREKKVEGMRQQVREWEKRTGKRRKLDLEGVIGGKKVVEQMVGPTVRALGVAGEVYRRELAVQSKEAGTM